MGEGEGGAYLKNWDHIINDRMIRCASPEDTRTETESIQTME